MSTIKKIIWGPYAYLIDLKVFILPYRKLEEEIFVNLNLQENQTVLDAGCGTGNICKFIWRKMSGRIKLTGIDFSQGMISRAKKRCHSKVFNFELVDLNKPLPFPDNFFDAIFTCHVLYNLTKPSFTLKEFLRVLKPGGKLVVATPQTNNPANVFSEHFRQIWQKRACLTLIQTLLLMPFFVGLVFYNLLLSWQSATSQDFFFSERELRDLLEKVGFREISTKTAYADVDIIASAEKKKEVSYAKLR